MIEAIVIGVGVFVFVALYVGGNRSIDTLTKHKFEEEAARRNRIASRANRGEYTGARYNAHGREIEG